MGDRAFALPSGAWWRIAPTHEGWLVAGLEGVGIVTQSFTALAVAGPVQALHFDGARTWFVAEKAAWICDASGLRRAVGLSALGEATSKARWLTSDGDDVIVSCPTHPRGHQGWGVHRVDGNGRVTGRFVVLDPPATFNELDPTMRFGDIIRTLRRHTMEEVVLGLDLTTVQPALGLHRLLATGVAGARTIASVPDYETRGCKLEVRHGRELEYVVPIDRHADRVTLGAGWAAWSSGNRLSVRKEDGTVAKPRVGGRVKDLASNGRELAALVIHADGPQLRVWTP